MRIDDKLSRLARGRAAGEDVTLDLIGYLILLRVAEKSREMVTENTPASAGVFGEDGPQCF